MVERLDKLLASQGLGTRKEVGKLIRAGKVTVNGEIARDPAQRLDAGACQVSVEGVEVRYRQHLTLMMNKPAGVLSATEDRRQPTVLDLLPEELRRRGLFPAGRLDKDTTGLLLLTDDGDLAHRMLSPKKHVYKRYLALLDGPITSADVEAFRQGVCWGEERYAPARLWAREEDPQTACVEIHEGRFHQVKRMFQARGKEVLALKRLKIGGLALDETLPAGAFRELEEDEIQRIFL